MGVPWGAARARQREVLARSAMHQRTFLSVYDSSGTALGTEDMGQNHRVPALDLTGEAAVQSDNDSRR